MFVTARGSTIGTSTSETTLPKTLNVALEIAKLPTLPKPWNKVNIFIASHNIYSLVNSIVVNQATMTTERE